MGLPLLKILTPKIIKGIMRYVFEKNELDVQMESMIKEVGKLRREVAKLKKKEK